MGRSLLDILLPPACVGCHRPGFVLCEACRGLARPLLDGADRFAGAEAGVFLGEALIAGIAASAHAGVVRQSLAALKYGGVSRLAPDMADLARPALDRLLWISGAATLVPVPVHRGRLAERGYNQAALLAGHLSRRANLPMRECLARIRPTEKQHRLNRQARLRNLRQAFVTVGSIPEVAVIVDDIVTTTATLEACASVLRAAGCRAVYGLAVAREL